jgi:hypothetical protein
MITYRHLTIVAVVGLLAACAQVTPVDPTISVSVSPPSAELAPGEARDFSASVTGAASGAVTWSATCGEIFGTGTQITYVAPQDEQECVLTATSVAAPQASGSAFIDVRMPMVEVDSTTDSTESVASLELEAGETRWIRVNIPSAQRGVDRRIVVEADDDDGRRELDLVLYEPDRVTPTASTSGAAFFRPGLQGIGGGFVGTALGAGSLRPLAAAPDVDRSVSVEGFCFGPCIARRAPNSLTHVYVRITNAGNTNTTVPFYAYTEPFIDERSPENDTPQGAVSVSQTESYRGAIEVLGDVDWVRFAQPGTIVVTQREGYDVNLRIELYDQTGTFVEAYDPGEPFVVIDGDRAAIGSDPQAQRASVYGFYDVDYQ